MTWQDQLKGDSLIMGAGTPSTRSPVPGNARSVGMPGERSRITGLPVKLRIRTGRLPPSWTRMDHDGFWVEPGPGYNPKYRSTVWAVILLAQLGASVKEDKRISHRRANTFWSMP